MTRARAARSATLVFAAAVISFALSAALAETPATTPAPSPAAATSEPAASPPAPAPTTTPAPSATPAPPPPAAAAPATPPTDQKAQTGDAFGEEQTLTAKTVVMTKGTADWDSAFDKIVESLKKLSAALDKQGIKPAGSAMIIYTSTDDNGFGFIAEIPVEQEVKNLPKDVTMGKSPDGKVLKFVHRGSYDNMDNTYEAITNHLDEQKLEAQDTFIEEYVTDPAKTAEDKLIINVYVPLK